MNLVNPDVLRGLVDQATTNLAKDVVPELQAALSEVLDGLEITITVRRKDQALLSPHSSAEEKQTYEPG